MCDCNSHRRILGKWALFKWRSPSPKCAVWLVQSSQAIAGRAALGRTAGAFMHSWSELLVKERKGLLHPEPFWLSWSSVIVEQTPFALCPAWTLTQGCRTSLPSAERSQQVLCEARSPLLLPKQLLPPPTAALRAGAPWGTCSCCHSTGDVTPFGQRLSLFVLARPELSLWACCRATVTRVLKNMFHVALNFI